MGDEGDCQTLEVSVSNEIKHQVETIKAMLASMEDGEISVSAYDTSWVALVEATDGSSCPQFPSSLGWIASNQLPDGSWGDGNMFLVHDRLISTLACVIALRKWNVHQDKCEKGLWFLNHNWCNLEYVDPNHMPIGFEITFPSVLDMAGRLHINISLDSPFLQDIYALRDAKLSKIPKDIMHSVPTTLLHSLEGMQGLDWEKLLKLQGEDGSFLFSPSATAFAFMQTKDENCLTYLNRVVHRFKGGAPNVYPVDLFEHIWVVDRLQRLGISRYFHLEINDCVAYILRYWTEDGICWARNSTVQDIDDTAMGFRVLRLQGHHVVPDVFHHFQKNGEFFCIAGQASQAVTGILSLYRAAQVLFPGEKILEISKEFSYNFLREKQASGHLLDKWLIAKDLQGEVEFALDVPWHASLPRIETRFYLDQYGGERDVWIGKTLYRMPIVNSNMYLKLAKMDYNNCQAVHRDEWNYFERWYEECNLGEFGINQRSLLLAYFLAAANLFEPERSKERIAWCKTTVLLEAMEINFNDDNYGDSRVLFVHQLRNGINLQDPIEGRRLDASRREKFLKVVLQTLNQQCLDASAVHGHDLIHDLHQVWHEYFLKWEKTGDRFQGEAELLVWTINFASAHWVPEKHVTCNPLYIQLSLLVNELCLLLGRYQKGKEDEKGKTKTTTTTTTPEIECHMQQIAQLALRDGNMADGLELDLGMKQVFLAVSKSFYYRAFFDSDTIDSHIAKVLFHRVR